MMRSAGTGNFADHFPVAIQDVEPALILRHRQQDTQWIESERGRFALEALLPFRFKIGGQQANSAIGFGRSELGSFFGNTRGLNWGSKMNLSLSLTQ